MERINLSKLDSNLLTRLANNALGREKPKYSWQHFTISILLVAKNFVKNLLITKSRDCKSVLVRGQASRPYSSTGRHLLLINWRVTFSITLERYYPKQYFIRFICLNSTSRFCNYGRLCNRAGHYIFALRFLLLSFFPRLISAVADWMSTILPHVVWP